VEVGVASARLNRMARSVDPAAPWAARHAARWDSETFATWARRNVRTSTARDLVRLVIWAVWAAEPEDLSLLHVLFYVSSAGSFEALIDTEGGAQDSRVVGGSQLIALRIAAELGAAVLLDTPVQRILLRGDQVTVKSPSARVRARRAIVAMTPALAGRIGYEPPLPALRDGLTQRMAQGSVVKCIAVYPEPFWREQGLSGQATSADGPVSVTYDNSPPGGSPGVLVAFLEAGAARRAADLPERERRALVIGCLTRLFGERAATPQRYIDKAWGRPVVRGMLRRLHDTRSLAGKWPRAARTHRPTPLGRRRDCHHLERLYGRRHRIGGNSGAEDHPGTLRYKRQKLSTMRVRPEL
jgi:monoamine oxidase